MLPDGKGYEGIVEESSDRLFYPNEAVSLYGYIVEETAAYFTLRVVTSRRRFRLIKGKELKP